MLSSMLGRLACVSLLLVPGAASAQTVFQMIANEGQVVPATGSPETGSGLFLFHPATSTLEYDITITGLTGGFLFAHLHLGVPGVSGGIRVTLSGGPTVFQGSAVLSAADVANLRNGDLYFNVHSATFPNGEIRGQVVPGLIQFNGVTTGAKILPPSGSAGTGDAEVIINPNNTVTYQVDFQGLGSNVTIAHIHAGKANANGAPFVPLTLTTAPGTSGTFAGTSAPLTDVEIARIRAGHSYVNIHSVNFGGGEIRGQLVPSFDRYGDPCNGIASLSGTGHTRPGGTITFNVANGVPGATPSLLVISFEGDDSAIQNGCTLHLALPITVFGLPPLDGLGALSGTVTIPSGLGPLPAPLTLQLQYFGKNLGQPGTLFATNGMTLYIDD